MRHRNLLLSFLICLLVAFVAYAQAPDDEPEQTDTEDSAEVDAAETEVSADEALEQNLEEILEDPAGDDTYKYDPQGRRDPFRSLIGPTPRLSRENAPPGPPGFMIDELDLQGVVQTRQGYVAMVRGPDNTGYLIREGDKVFDGEVVRVTANSVVFRQAVNDPTRIERYREVVKELSAQTGQPKGRRR